MPSVTINARYPNVDQRTIFLSVSSETIMTKYYAAAVALLFISPAAFASQSATVAAAVDACCAALDHCCEEVMDCCDE
jgi:hypothetical protein